MQRLALRASLACSILLLCFGILAGCATVPIQTGSSATAPAITWVVTQVGAPTPQTFGANGTLTIQAGIQYDVSMHATSPSGVKSLSVNGTEDWGCVSSDGTGQSGTGDLTPQTVSQTAKNGQAMDELFSFQTVEFPQSPCQSGFTFTGGGIGLQGTATNFANEQSSGHLALVVTP
jgi:hypothetical protein